MDIVFALCYLYKWINNFLSLSFLVWKVTLYALQDLHLCVLLWKQPKGRCKFKHFSSTPPTPQGRNSTDIPYPEEVRHTLKIYFLKNDNLVWGRLWRFFSWTKKVNNREQFKGLVLWGRLLWSLNILKLHILIISKRIHLKKSNRSANHVILHEKIVCSSADWGKGAAYPLHPSPRSAPGWNFWK